MTDLAVRSYASLKQGFDWLGSVWVLAALIPVAVVLADRDNIAPFMETAAVALGGTLPYIRRYLGLDAETLADRIAGVMA